MIQVKNRSLQNVLSVLLIPLYDRKWASSRYRLYNYVPRLERSGINCKVIVPPQRKLLYRLMYLLRVVYHAGKVDVVFIQKKVFKKVFMCLLSMVNSNIIFDLDDALFAKPTSIPPDKFDKKKVRESLNYVLLKSRKVIVGNKFIRDYVVQINPDVTIVPTPVYTYPDTSPMEQRGDKPNDKVVIGWIGNKENLICLKEMENIFRQLSLRLKDQFVIKVICDEPLYLRSFNIINSKWSLEDEFKELMGIDIGIMPLKDDDWSEGKCAFKLLQFMSIGIPVVASPIGMNAEVIRHGISGYLAETEEEWIMRISSLVNDYNLRKDLGTAGKNLVDSKYSYKATTETLILILKECVK